MEILSFVKAEEIDQVYFDSSLRRAGRRRREPTISCSTPCANRLLRRRKVTLHGRENIVIIRARDNGFTLHTMFYKNEIRSIAKRKLNQAELKPAESARDAADRNAAESFNPDQYSDTYQQELEKLIERKPMARS
jgi:DNA end-binding protein Ku